MRLEAEFVMPIKVPAKLGARSIWLMERLAPWQAVAPVATHRQAMTRTESHPAKARQVKAMAGKRRVRVANNFLVRVTDKWLLNNSQSAIRLAGYDRIQLIR